MEENSKKLIKKITTNELAVMINNVTEKMATKEQVEKMQKDINEIKFTLKETIKRTDKLENRMDYAENKLGIEPLKA